jgi:hypothetical protein
MTFFDFILGHWLGVWGSEALSGGKESCASRDVLYFCAGHREMEGKIMTSRDEMDSENGKVDPQTNAFWETDWIQSV